MSVRCPQPGSLSSVCKSLVLQYDVNFPVDFLLLILAHVCAEPYREPLGRATRAQARGAFLEKVHTGRPVAREDMREREEMSLRSGDTFASAYPQHSKIRAKSKIEFSTKRIFKKCTVSTFTKSNEPSN